MVLEKDFLGLYPNGGPSPQEDEVLGVSAPHFRNSNLRICGGM